MIFVLVFWKILPGSNHRSAFLRQWRELMPVCDRSGLIAEFLNAPIDSSDFAWVDSSLNSKKAYQDFMTVGLWNTAGDFVEQLSQYFRINQEKESFEYEKRTRIILSPEAWRVGTRSLPLHDSTGIV